MRSRPVLFIVVLTLFISCAQEGGKVNEETRQKTLLEQADSVFNSGEYEQARFAYEKALAEAQAESNNSDMTEALSMIARCYLIQEEKDTGRKWLDKAEPLANEDEPGGWSRYLGVLGRFQWQDKEMDKATVTFKNMYAYCSEHKLHSRAVDAAHMVAITGTPEEQVEWGLKGIEQAEAGNVTGWLGPLWNNLGWTYEDIGDYEKSLDAYIKAREYHHQYGTERNKHLADWAVGHAYRLNGQYDEAEEFVKPLLPKFIAAEDGEFIGLTHHELGEIEFARGNYREAVDHLVIAKDKMKEAGMPEWDPAGYEKIIERLGEARRKVKG